MRPLLKVLVTSAGAAPAVAVIKALRQQERYDVEIGSIDMQLLSVGRALTDWFALVPGGTAPEFPARVLELCRERGVQYVFPIVDEELPVWAANRARFAAHGIVVLVNPGACIERANDKALTIAHCVKHGIDLPRSYAPGEARALPSAAFPLFGKPRAGRGSIGARRLSSPAQLADFLAEHPDGIVQELLVGREFTVDVLVGSRAELLAAVPKERLEVKSGMATKSVTRAVPALVPVVTRIAAAFGIAGAANIQLMLHQEQWKLIEVNPKFATSLPLTVAAGVNLPLLLLEIARGEFSHPTPLAFRSELVMLRCWEEHFLENEVSDMAVRTHP